MLSLTENTPTLFAYGELYCFAVIFGLCRVIFAAQVSGRIEYHCEAQPNNITARRAILLINSRKERVLRNFVSTLPSLLFFIAGFIFVVQMHRTKLITLSVSLRLPPSPTGEGFAAGASPCPTYSSVLPSVGATCGRPFPLAIILSLIECEPIIRRVLNIDTFPIG